MTNGLFGSMYATPGGVDPLAVMQGIVQNQDAPPSMYATPGGVDPGAIMAGIVQQFSQQQAQQPAPAPAAPNYNGSLYYNPQTMTQDPLAVMANFVKTRKGAGAPPPTNLPIWAGGAGNGVPYGHGPMGPPAPYYQPPKQAQTGPQEPPQAPADNPWGSLNGGSWLR